MSDWHRENAIKLDILEAIARSQSALAQMTESIAASPLPAGSDNETLAHSLKVLARYQFSLAETITGIRLRNTKEGQPGEPWLHASVCGRCGKH